MHSLLRCLVSALLSLGCIASARAAPCLSQSLSDYLTLPAAGCEVGPVNFSEFSLPSVFPPATAFDPSLVTVAPISDALGRGFSLLLGSSVGAGEFVSLRLGFNVSALTLIGTNGALTDPAASGDGVVTLLGDLCLEGPFTDPTNLICSTASVANLVAIETELFSDPAAMLAFAPTGLLGVVADIGIDGGLSGVASLASAELRFVQRAVVPVPSVLLLLALGALAASAGLRKRGPAYRALRNCLTRSTHTPNPSPERGERHVLHRICHPVT